MSLFLQTVALSFTALLLDGGVLLRVCVVAALAYWFGAIVVVLRRPRHPTDNDIILIKYGFPLAIACVVIVQSCLAVLSRVIG